MTSANTWAAQCNAKPLEQNLGSFKEECSGSEWWHTLLIPGLRMHRKVDLGEFEAILIFMGIPGHPELHSDT